MAQIPQYDEQVQAQGSIQAQANPVDFGAGIGQATENIGAGIGDAAHAAFRMEQDQGRIWGYDAASKGYQGLQQELTDKVNALDPTQPQADFTASVSNLTKDFSSRIDEVTQDMMQQAPSKSAAKLVESHMSNYGRVLLNQAIHEQARITGEYTGELVKDGMRSDQDLISKNTSNENFGAILANRDDFIKGLSNVDPVAKMKWLDEIKHGLSVTQVQVAAATHPQEFLADVNAGGGRLTMGGSAKGAVPGGDASVSGGAVTAAPDDLGGDTVKPFGTTKMSEIFQQVKQPSQYDDLFDAAGKKYGINPTELKLRAAVESGLNPNATNPTGATGIAQFMPKTAQAMGINPADPAQSIDAMAKLVAGFQGKANGDTAQIDKMYYGGEDGTKWGANTSQYAANLASVRSMLDASATPPPGAELPQVEPLSDGDIAKASPTIAGWQNLTWQEKVNAVRQAEAAVGGHLATDRGSMIKELKDVHETLMSGQGYPGLDDTRFSAANFTRLFGPDNGGRIYDQLQYVKNVGGFMGQMATMPVAQAAATLKGLIPAPGPEYADKSPIYIAAADAFKQTQKLRNDDYMSWATKSRIPGVQPVDFSTADAFGKSIISRIGPANTGRTDYAADAHLLSKDEADQLGGILSYAAPAQQIEYLKSLSAATKGQDAWYSDAIAQIAPKNPTVAWAGVAANRQGTVQTSSGPQDGGAVGKYILEGTHILQGKDIDDPQHTGKPFAFDEKMFRTNFWNAVGFDAFKSGDAQRGASDAADTYQAVKSYLAADLYHTGSDPTNITADQVKNAVTAVTGGVTKSPNGDNLFRPWGMAEPTFLRNLPQAAQVAINTAGLHGTPLDNLSAYHYVNLAEGKYGLMANGTQMLTSPLTGRTVVVDLNGIHGTSESHAGRIQ